MDRVVGCTIHLWRGKENVLIITVALFGCVNIIQGYVFIFLLLFIIIRHVFIRMSLEISSVLSVTIGFGPLAGKVLDSFDCRQLHVHVQISLRKEAVDGIKWSILMSFACILCILPGLGCLSFDDPSIGPRRVVVRISRGFALSLVALSNSA